MDSRDRSAWVDLGPIEGAGDQPQRSEVDGTPVVVARLGDDVLVAADRCPHRGAPLSAGTIEHDCLVCPYHGWAFDQQGEVAAIPALGRGARLPKRARLRTAEADVADGRVRVDAASVPVIDAVARTAVNDAVELRSGWHPVCRSEEVGAGTEVEVSLLGESWTVVRGEDGRVTCEGAHGVVDHVGHVWVSLDEPLAELLPIPEFDELDWHHVPMPRVEGRYGVGLLLDNQLDAGHFPFVHRDTFGSSPGEALPAYEVDRDGLGFEVVLRVPISARNDVKDAEGIRSIDQHRTMTYRYRAPSTLFLRLDYEEMGGSTGILFCFTPLDRDTSRMDVDLLFTHPEGFTDEQLAERLAFEVSVVAEDLALQDRFDFLDLPLDLTAEIHTKADRSAVEMRRILTDLFTAAAARNPEAPTGSAVDPTADPSAA